MDLHNISAIPATVDPHIRPFVLSPLTMVITSSPVKRLHLTATLEKGKAGTGIVLIEAYVMLLVCLTFPLLEVTHTTL